MARPATRYSLTKAHFPLRVLAPYPWYMANRRLIRKVLVSMGGGILTALGLIGIAVPIMPGFLFLIPGLFLLSLEFAWAERALTRTRSWINRPRDEPAGDMTVPNSDIEASS